MGANTHLDKRVITVGEGKPALCCAAGQQKRADLLEPRTAGESKHTALCSSFPGLSASSHLRHLPPPRVLAHCSVSL